MYKMHIKYKVHALLHITWYTQGVQKVTAGWV